MRRAGSPRVEGYAALTALGLVAALALHRPELSVLAVPFALALVLGVHTARDPNVDFAFTLSTDRTVEDSEVEAVLTVSSQRDVDRLEYKVALPSGIELVEGSDARALRLRSGEERSLPLRLRCRRWGVHPLGAVDLRARDRLRLVVWEQRFPGGQRLKAYPHSETVRRILQPRETRVFTGSDVARARAEGIEYADMRAYTPGDRLRSINWRASARRNELVVNERHPERNTDVVLFIDSFGDVRGETRSTLDDTVRAAATLATRYLERRDRVGLVGFGGVLRWLQPGMGRPQWFRIVETLLETWVEPTYVWRKVSVIPDRILPPKALIIALTPLLDSRFVAAVTDLRARGYDLVVVEIVPTGQVEPGPSRADQLAHRLWLLERDVLRADLERADVSVARWGEDVALAAALEEVRTYRRHARLGRV